MKITDTWTYRESELIQELGVSEADYSDICAKVLSEGDRRVGGHGATRDYYLLPEAVIKITQYIKGVGNLTVFKKCINPRVFRCKTEDGSTVNCIVPINKAKRVKVGTVLKAEEASEGVWKFIQD